MTTSVPPLYSHQREVAEYLCQKDRLFLASDPGTGKTRAILHYITVAKNSTPTFRALIIAPKSILRPSWMMDIVRFTDLTWAIAEAGKHKAAFSQNADVTLINHDGVVAMHKAGYTLENFDLVVIDESTAFKHPNTQRSTAIRKLIKPVKKRVMMSGTPAPNGVMDLWHQYYLLDEGESLGSKFYATRNILCTPTAFGAFTKWQDRPEAMETAASLVAPKTLRHRFEDVLDIPANHQYTLTFSLSKQVLAHYAMLKSAMALQLKDKTITVTNAASHLSKLLQVASGTIYDEQGVAHLVHDERYKLVLELIKQRGQSLVAFNWKHQRDRLSKYLVDENISFSVIDGSATAEERHEAVQAFQKQQTRVILAHPASAAHGLTLTAGTSTIWCSPTYNSEHFLQFNRRIYRAGQTQKTETVLVAAEDTVDLDAYEKLQGKLDALQLLLGILNP